MDEQGNDRRRWIAKDGGASMVLIEGMTENAYTALENIIRNFARHGGGKVKVRFKPIP